MLRWLKLNMQTTGFGCIGEEKISKHLITFMLLVKQPSYAGESGPPGRSSLDSVEMAYARQVSVLERNIKPIAERRSLYRGGKIKICERNV